MQRGFGVDIRRIAEDTVDGSYSENSVTDRVVESVSCDEAKRFDRGVGGTRWARHAERKSAGLRSMAEAMFSKRKVAMLEATLWSMKDGKSIDR